MLRLRLRSFVLRCCAIAPLLLPTALLATTTAAAAQPATSSALSAPSATAPAPAPAHSDIDPSKLKVQLSDVSSAGESVHIQISGIEADLANDAATTRISDQLSALSSEIDARTDESQRLVGSNPSLQTLRSLEEDWQTYSNEINAAKKALVRRADQLNALIGQLKGEQDDWQQTLAYANRRRQNYNLQDIETRAQATIASLSAEQQRVQDALDGVHSLVRDADDQDARVIEVLASVREARQEAFSHLLMRDAPPAWSEVRHLRQAGQVLAAGQSSLSAQMRALGAYARRNAPRFGLHGAVLLVLASFLLWTRRRVRRALAHDPSLAAATPVFQSPLLTSIVLGFLVSIWIYPQAPRLLWAIVGASALVPTVLILRRLVDRRLLSILDAMVAFYFVDQMRQVVATEPLLSRGLFLLEMGAGVLFLASFLASTRSRVARQAPATEPLVLAPSPGTPGEGRGEGDFEHRAILDDPNHPHPNPLPAYREKGPAASATSAAAPAPPPPAPAPPGDLLYIVTRRFVRVVMVVFAVAFLANLLGYVSLANLVGDGTLGSAYLAIILYATIRLVDGMLLIALRVRPLAYLALFRRNEPAIRARVTTALHWLAIAFWLYATLQMFWLWDRTESIARSVLSTELSFGSIHFSLGPLVAFLLTMWGAFLVSRLLRFVLEQDVYGRLPMSGGLSYAISRMLHYAVLLVGFFIAIGVAGYPLTQLTILGSAFAVGIGFGMQNIVNNFVSGLILLFERPIKVGDLVQLGDSTGTVSHIGIRASIIRTADSSEIIVPNGNLISNQVTNWTLSNRQRGIQIPVAVAPGTDPHKMIQLLQQVAAAQDHIVDSPAPEALLTSFDGSAFHFTLRAFTSQPERYAEISSDLAVAIHDALAREHIEIK